MVRTIRNRRLRQEVVSFVACYHEELVTFTLNHAGDGRERVLILIVFVERGRVGGMFPTVDLPGEVNPPPLYEPQQGAGQDRLLFGVVHIPVVALRRGTMRRIGTAEKPLGLP